MWRVSVLDRNSAWFELLFHYHWLSDNKWFIPFTVRSMIPEEQDTASTRRMTWRNWVDRKVKIIIRSLPIKIILTGRKKYIFPPLELSQSACLFFSLSCSSYTYSLFSRVPPGCTRKSNFSTQSLFSAGTSIGSLCSRLLLSRDMSYLINCHLPY